MYDIEVPYSTFKPHDKKRVTSYVIIIFMVSSTVISFYTYSICKQVHTLPLEIYNNKDDFILGVVAYLILIPTLCSTAAVCSKVK